MLVVMNIGRLFSDTPHLTHRTMTTTTFVGIPSVGYFQKVELTPLVKYFRIAAMFEGNDDM